MTQWCGEAWSQIDHVSVVRGFKKLGITTALDWSEGHLVNITKLPEYAHRYMPTDYMQNEFTVDSEGESDTGLGLSSEDSDSDTEANYAVHFDTFLRTLFSIYNSVFSFISLNLSFSWDAKSHTIKRPPK